MTSLIKVLSALGLVVLGAFLGAGVIQGLQGSEEVDERSMQETPDGLPFLNPVVSSNLEKHFIINFRPLRESLERIQSEHKHATYIYFSYLNNASWIGLGEREEVTAASTIKVPIAMSLLKAVEEKKISLDDTYALEEIDLDQGFGELYKVGLDKTFTVAELMEIMLVQSDNTALGGLVSIFNHIGIEDPLQDAYGFLGWELTQEVPGFGEQPNYSKITLKTLANIFIALYDAKYISTEHSNMILEYLARTPFDDRIAAGVPKGVMVSHKIGTAAGDNTYSDCGIVYAPNRNYLLCLASEGAPEKLAAEFMADVSREVYNYVISN